MLVTAVNDPELLAYAKSKGAHGINMAGICCTSNETLMRQGVPSAGNFLHQELSILTGSVEAMIVDVQCIMQALVSLSERFHTKIITTSPIQFGRNRPTLIASLPICWVTREFEYQVA